MINLNILDRVANTLRELDHSMTRQKLYGFDNIDCNLMDVLMEPGGIVGAFFYTLNLICMEWYPPMSFAPMKIEPNMIHLDKLAVTITPIESKDELYGINLLQASTVDALIYATLDRLFEPVIDPRSDKMIGVRYKGCPVFFDKSLQIQIPPSNIAIAHAFCQLMGKTSSQFIAAEKLVLKLQRLV